MTRASAAAEIREEIIFAKLWMSDGCGMVQIAISVKLDLARKRRVPYRSLVMIM